MDNPTLVDELDVTPTTLEGTYEFATIPARMLQLDTAHYQRQTNPARARRIARDFDPDLMDPLKVNHRQNDEYMVIDGGHRLAAIQQLDLLDMPVPCILYDGLSIEEEAEIFAAQNNRTQINPNYEFKARVTSLDPHALRIVEAVQAAGLEVDLPPHSGRANTVKAVRAIEAIYNRSGAEMLTRVLQVAKDAFAGSQSAYHGDVLKGLQLFFTLNPQASVSRTATQLQRIGLNKLMAEALTTRSVVGTSGKATNVYAWVIHREYNYKLSTNRLPEWRLGASRPERG